MALEVTRDLLSAIEQPRRGTIAYDSKNLVHGVHENGEPGLLMRVEFNTQQFDLDLIEVDAGVHIAYLNEDPNSGHESIARATGVEKARLILNLHAQAISMGKPNGIEAVFTIESRKSTPSAQLATQLFSAAVKRQIPFEVLVAKTEIELVTAGSVVEPVKYLPITAQKEKKYKYLGVSLYQAELMWDIYRRGKGIFIFVDDAYTTGASAKAADEAAKIVTLNSRFKMHKVVDIREQPLMYPYIMGNGYPAAVETDVHPVRIFPEFIGAKPIPNAQ